MRYEQLAQQHSLSEQDIHVWPFYWTVFPNLRWCRHKTDSYIASMPCAHYLHDGMRKPFRYGGYDISISGDEDGLFRENQVNTMVADIFTHGVAKSLANNFNWNLYFSVQSLYLSFYKNIDNIGKQHIASMDMLKVSSYKVQKYI